MLEWKTNQPIEKLIEEIEELTVGMNEEDKNHWWDMEGCNFPVAPKYSSLVCEYASYPIWACNDTGWCLVGDRADQIEHISDIQEEEKWKKIDSVATGDYIQTVIGKLTHTNGHFAIGDYGPYYFCRETENFAVEISEGSPSEASVAKFFIPKLIKWVKNIQGEEK